MLHSSTLLQARPTVGNPTTTTPTANGYTLEITVSEPHLSQLKKAGYVLCLGIKCDWPSGVVPNGAGAAALGTGSRRVGARNGGGGGGYVVWYARGGYMSHNLFKWYDRFEVRCFAASSSSSASATGYPSPASASSLLEHPAPLGGIGDGSINSGTSGSGNCYGEELGKCEVTPGQTLLITSRGLSVSPTHREEGTSSGRGNGSHPNMPGGTTYAQSNSGPGREIRILNTLSGSRSVRLEFWQVLGERLVNIHECIVPAAQPQLQLHSQLPLLAPFLTSSTTSVSASGSSSSSVSSRSGSPSPATFNAYTQPSTPSKQNLVMTPGKVTLGPPANVIRMWWERPPSTSLSPPAEWLQQQQCSMSSSPSSSIMEEQGQPSLRLAQGQFEVQVGSGGGGGEVRVGFGNGTVGVGSGGCFSGMGSLVSARGRWELR